MGEAREVLDRLTEAVFSRDWDALGRCYASNAVLVTPDQGEVSGTEEVVKWSRDFLEAFEDARYEPLYEHEAGNTAIDEGYFVGTNTGPLPSPTGESMPATGNSVRFRACDIATVEDGVITSHRFYFDQMEFLGQLGIIEAPA
jgi:ketosteroid isomerase-like protein